MRQFWILISMFTFASCKVADDKPITPANTNSAFSYFVSAQYAFNSAPMAERMSSMIGATYVATKDSSFKTWAQPEMGCTFAMNDTINFKAVRALNVGNLIVTDASNKRRIVKPTEKFLFQKFSDFVLKPGMASIQTNAKNPNFSTNQKFLVLNAGSDIRWRVHQTDEQFDLPTPSIVDQNNPNFIAHLVRGSAHTVSYTAPKDTSYVKVTITDGATETGGEVVCYGEASSGFIDIPAVAFSHFVKSTQGRLQVDFYSVNFQEWAENIEQSIVISYKRHIHGFQNVQIGGQVQGLYFGALLID